VRFAPVVQSNAPAESLRAWLEAGHHADMDWLPRSLPKRLKPDLMLPGARSWIVLGINYRPVSAPANVQQRWAKYALWSDYHDTIGRGLRAAEQVLERELGLRRDDYRSYTDTGPVQERGWAAASGLGWRGRNGMLISREHGNWL